MKITARCHPALEAFLPKPVPAAQMMPDWLGDMPDHVIAASVGNLQLPSLKRNDLVVGAMGLGLMILTPTDIVIRNGEVTWAWDIPFLPDLDLPRAPVGPYAPERAQGSPYVSEGVMIEFLNFWQLEPPAGFELLVSHPHGFEHLPFRTLSGRIGSGQSRTDFPATLDPGFEGRIAKGTPVAQIVAVPRSCEVDAKTA